MARSKSAQNAGAGLTEGARVRKVKPAPVEPPTLSKRSYIRQSDVPTTSLDEALRLPQAIFDHYAGKPTSPFNVAKALNVDVKGSQLRLLSGAAIAFGLIEGGAQAASISVTDLARSIFRPKSEGEEIRAKREAVLKPRIFNEFLSQYDGNQLPRSDIAVNVLEEKGVPRDKTSDVYERIVETARSVGYIQELKGKYYVQLGVDAVEFGGRELDSGARSNADSRGAEREEVSEEEVGERSASSTLPAPRGAAMVAAAADDQRRRRVFITHGKDRALVDPIKKLLEYGELEPVVSVERQSVSKPVPEKVMDDMRRCGAAIIHVDADRVLKDNDGNENVIINSNVLIEIGAAMAFYGRRFILLVKDGVKLPSNLQGLYEVRYKGDGLDATATINLLEAMKDIKNHALPTDVEGE